jgi:hypothetical protein
MPQAMTFKTTGPHVTWEAFDDEYIVLEMNTGTYFSLAGGAAVIWTGITAGADLGELSAGLPHGSEEKAAFDTCLNMIITAGLIMPSTDPASPAASLAARIAEAGTDYRIEAFDDLSALLLADPVHDVQPEMGWPHLPQ